MSGGWNLIKTVICDDNEKALYLLGEFIKKINLKEIELVGEAENGEKLIEACNKTSPDLVILDIDMPDINGITVAVEIMKRLPKTLFIFITAYPEYALDSFKVRPADYIIKPYSIEKLKGALMHVIERLSEREINQTKGDTIIFLSERKKHEINQEDILFIEKVDRQTVVHTLFGTIETYESLESILKRLDADIFFRVHKSYIINSKAKYKTINTLGRTKQIKFDNYEKVAYLSRKNIEKFNDKRKINK